ncbi:MAG: hypothetical protein Q7S68_02490, partial [Deltaproteobacteria bacterium]|nr:hypothetical protein [Deltaproteobacteria bacterium]
EAFALQGLPRPDTTTINGRRIFYSHIDGDGIVSKSHIDNKSYTGEIILREILQKYPTLPITASFISGYFDMPAYQTERAEEMARAIASLPNTEVASHGHAHPLSWRKQKLALDVPGYTYSDTAEILGSAEKINARLKKWGIDKKVSLFSWTGDCFPTEEQTAIPAQGNLLNINGGDSRFDKRYPSYAYLYPLGIARGNSRQIYAGNANEHPYTSGWEGPFYGFQEVIETFQNTESPVRIKPINLYYHYYSGETFASLHVLKKAYDYALSQDIFPMFASQYAALVQDFFDLQIILLPNGGTRIRNSGHLRTIRWDHETRNVNLERSRGVLGFSHFQGSLYVFLDEGKTHDIYLTN